MTAVEESFVKTYLDSVKGAGGAGTTGTNNPALEESEKVTPLLGMSYTLHIT